MAAILGVAAPAAGVCTRAELRAAGVPDRTIGDQVRAEVLIRVGHGLYQVPALITAETPYHRAAKAYPRGAISHLSAARLDRAPIPPPDAGEPVEVSVLRPGGAHPKLPGVVVHRVRQLPGQDVVEFRPGLRVTSPARTIVDLAGVAAISDRRLRHVIETQVVARRVTLAEVAGCHARVGGPGVAGSGRLGRLIDELDDGQPVPDSELERRLAPLLGPAFCRQYRPPWYDGVRGVVDFAEPQSRVIVEADGRSWHSTGQAMTDDRRRDRVAAQQGWLVVRVTWTDVVDRPEATAAEVGTVVSTRGRAAA